MKDKNTKVFVKYHITDEQERTSIDSLGLGNRCLNVLKAAGIISVGQILSHWNEFSNINLPGRKSGLGATSVKEIHAATFAWLCENQCVTKVV